METPSSTRRITRSQTRAGLANSATINATNPKKMEESEKILSKTKQRTGKQDRLALIDITNDSPIVGLASGSLATPISSIAKQRSSCCKRTPGSGEALLRSQVKTLLQRVEEEAEISKFSLESEGQRPIPKNLKDFLNFPYGGILAPTPANTPQVLNFSDADVFDSLGSVSGSPIQDELNISEVVSGIFNDKNHSENGSELDKDVTISRTLFPDFSEKSDYSSDCSSVVTCKGTGLTNEDEDASSIWSIQVNASTQDDDDDDDDDEAEAEAEGIYDASEYGDGKENDESVLLEELCEGISKMNVGPTTFMGKHTRFVYNSDDELVVNEENENVLRLKGLPTPKGKHLRFQDEEQ